MNERGDSPYEWVGDAVLNALGVDRWDKHVDEMLKYDSRPIPGPMATDIISTSEQVKIKNLIKRELAARMDDKTKEIVDAAIAARLPALTQPNSTNTMANTIANNINRKILRELDQLQRLELDERSLKFELVDRLFQIPTGGLGQPGSRFETSTRGLQYGDKVTSVLVSFVEALVVKVNMLQTKVDAMEYVLEAYAASGMYYGEHLTE
ncbi:hypothetical protein E8E13_008761 [Curvularia kusanoi]|uniref:Uncharacterized protein n=1 Tax=Curvularia kusanoi TaxID=90978 RepID=A0A9P4WCP3_CURKU|nr:hypothetical protein E8E13_008761 [Curvularia kusanoi]